MTPRSDRYIPCGMLFFCGDVMENPFPYLRDFQLECLVERSWFALDDCNRWFQQLCQTPLSVHLLPESNSSVESRVFELCTVVVIYLLTLLSQTILQIFSYHIVHLSNKFDPFPSSKCCALTLLSPGAPITSSLPSVNRTVTFD